MVLCGAKKKGENGKRGGGRTHHVHAGQLGPDLGEDADVGAPDHVRFEEFEVAGVAVAALELAHVLDFLKLLGDKGAIWVAFAVDEGQDGMAIFPSVFLC